MVEPSFFEQPDQMREAYTSQSALEVEQAELMTRWESLGTALEAADERLATELEIGR